MNHQGTKTQRESIGEAINQVARQIVNSAFVVHSELGPGLLESVYQVCLVYELRKQGLGVDPQVNYPLSTMMFT